MLLSLCTAKSAMPHTASVRKTIITLLNRQLIVKQDKSAVCTISPTPVHMHIVILGCAAVVVAEKNKLNNIDIFKIVLFRNSYILYILHRAMGPCRRECLTRCIMAELAVFTMSHSMLSVSL